MKDRLLCGARALLAAVLAAAVTPAAGSALAAAPPGPVQPLKAWTVAGDTGDVFVLDAATSVHRLAAGDLAPLARSPALFPAGDAGGTAHLAADGTRVFAGSDSVTQTLVLSSDGLGRWPCGTGPGPWPSTPAGGCS